MTHDPLLQYEQIEHNYVRKVKKTSKVFRFFKFIVLYMTMSACVFSVFMGVLNF